MRGVIVMAALAATLVAAGASAWAAGYATDDRGRIYQVWPDESSAELLGTVRVTEVRGGKPVTHVPVLTDLALSDLHGLYGISFTDLYKIDVRDPARSTRIGSLAGSSGFFNALAFDAAGNLFALQKGVLHRVDLARGKATAVGALGGTFTSSGDLAWVGDALYASVDRGARCHLVRVDPKTGKATDVGAFRRAGRSSPAGGGAAPAPRPPRLYDDVWGLIWDGRRLLALTAGGEVLEIDRRDASVKPLYRIGVTWHGSCPMLRI